MAVQSDGVWIVSWLATTSYASSNAVLSYKHTVAADDVSNAWSSDWAARMDSEWLLLQLRIGWSLLVCHMCQ